MNFDDFISNLNSLTMATSSRRHLKSKTSPYLKNGWFSLSKSDRLFLDSCTPNVHFHHCFHRFFFTFQIRLRLFQCNSRIFSSIEQKIEQKWIKYSLTKLQIKIFRKRATILPTFFLQNKSQWTDIVKVLSYAHPPSQCLVKIDMIYM